MASEIRVNKIENRSGLGTVTFADTGVDLAGIVTATTFSGSGASLTNLPAANVTGTLPAISGANLTNIPAANVTGTLPAISAANLTNIPAANVTGTLPAISGANLTSLTAANLTGSLPAISAASCTSIPAANIVGLATAGFERSGGFGITHASSWYLTSSFTGTTNPVTAWGAYTGAHAGTLGSAMSVSSGVFTFPTTGVWLISLDTGFNFDGDSRYNRGEIRCTADNGGSYSLANSPYCFVDDVGYSGAGYFSHHTDHIFDVTDTSTHKCIFSTECISSSVTIWMMALKFTRLGDT